MNERHPGLPVILTSGYAERLGQDLAALGICLRLDKPFDRQALSEAPIRRLWERCLAAVIWLLTPPAMLLATWLTRRRHGRKKGRGGESS